MPQVIGYAVAVAALLSVVGVCGEQLLARWALPRRMAWCLAMLASMLFPLLMMSRAHPVPAPAPVAAAVAIHPSLAAAPVAAAQSRTRSVPAAGRAPATATVRAPTAVATAAPSTPASLTAPASPFLAATSAAHWHPALPSGRLILALWTAASSLLLLYVSAASAMLHYRASRWRREAVMGNEVLISQDTGPALLGALRPRIVVPRWYLEEPAATQVLIMQHEQQHISGRDPLLLWGAVLVVVALPWNLPLWWQLRRLRLAIELDCDARVLRAGADAGRYGEVLLAVTQRAAGLRGVAIAMSQSMSALERRVRNLARVSPRHAGLRTAAALLVAVAGAAAATMLKAPVMPGTGTDAGSHAAVGGTVMGSQAVAAINIMPPAQNATPERRMVAQTAAAGTARSRSATPANPLECLDQDLLRGLLQQPALQTLNVSTIPPRELAAFKAPRELHWVAAGERGYGVSIRNPSASQTSVSAVYRSSLPPDAARTIASGALTAGGWKLQFDSPGMGSGVFVSGSSGGLGYGSETYCRAGQPVSMSASALDGVTYVILSVNRNQPAGFGNPCDQPQRVGHYTNGFDQYLPKLELPRDPATGQPVAVRASGGSGDGANVGFMLKDSAANVARYFAGQMAAQGWNADANWSGQGTAGSTWTRKADADTTVQATLEVSAFDEGRFTVALKLISTK
ncbi:MAG TPA: M56 family metallopeptidase [Steroidobacteraceae bacterium]|nr:M56 family metallopeptidase [Steroidobacteraceae bacterium]